MGQRHAACVWYLHKQFYINLMLAVAVACCLLLVPEVRGPWSWSDVVSYVSVVVGESSFADAAAQRGLIVAEGKCVEVGALPGRNPTFVVVAIVLVVVGSSSNCLTHSVSRTSYSPST
jgi:hypothetical protein